MAEAPENTVQNDFGESGCGVWLKFPDGIPVVIGGSGGVGRAICQGFAAAGCDIVFTYRSNFEAAKEVAGLIEAQGRSAEFHQLSTSDASALEAFVQGVVIKHGKIHTVVNASGSNIAMRFIGDVDSEEWCRVMDEDVNGFFHLVKATLPHLREQGGSYVNISSVGLQRWPSRDVLSVAPKAAIGALMTGIAREEGRAGVRANSVALGVIEAGLFQRLKGKDLDTTWEEAAIGNTALKRFGTPEEVADAVIFLASNRARYITGQTITLDGGYSL